MFSLGSRLQSANVRWSPSRKRRCEVRRWGSRASSCSRGELRYSSSFSKARSRLRCSTAGRVARSQYRPAAGMGALSAVASSQPSPVSRQHLSASSHLAQAGTCLCPLTETWHSHTDPHREGSAWTDPGVDWVGGLGKLSMTRLGFGVWHLRGCMGCSPTHSSPSSWAGTGFLMKAENLWKMSFPARLDSGYCGTRLGHLWGHGHS